MFWEMSTCVCFPTLCARTLLSVLSDIAAIWAQIAPAVSQHGTLHGRCRGTRRSLVVLRVPNCVWNHLLCLFVTASGTSWVFFFGEGGGRGRIEERHTLTPLQKIHLVTHRPALTLPIPRGGDWPPPPPSAHERTSSPGGMWLLPSLRHKRGWPPNASSTLAQPSSAGDVVPAGPWLSPTERRTSASLQTTCPPTSTDNTTRRARLPLSAASLWR